MATQYQIDYVKDLEAASAALRSQGILQPKVGQLMEHAGVNPAGLFQIVERMKVNKEKELLGRLRNVFETARKMPLCLENVKPLVLESKTVDYVETERETEPIASPKKVDTAIEWNSTDHALQTVMSALRPLHKKERERVLSASSVYFGVGE